MNKSIILCIFGLLVPLHFVAAEGAETKENVGKFKNEVEEVIKEEKLTCENYDQFCAKEFAEDDPDRGLCQLVLEGYICKNLKEGEGLEKLFLDTSKYIRDHDIDDD